MRNTLLVAGAIVLALSLPGGVVAYWSGPFLAPPPIPRPPGQFTMMPGAGWDRGHRTHPSANPWRARVAGAQPAAGVPWRGARTPPKVRERQAASAAAPPVPMTPPVECESHEPAEGVAAVAPAVPDARTDADAVSRLSAELAQVRAELMASTRRVHKLLSEREELKMQFGSSMGDVASVRNAFEQVRKRAVEVGTSLADSQVTDVGGGFEREFLKADLDRLIAALALADAVLSDAGSARGNTQGPGGEFRGDDWRRPAGEADMVEAASFESDR